MDFHRKALTATQLYEQIVSTTTIGDIFSVAQRRAIDRAVIARLIASERFRLVAYWSDEVQLERIA